MASMTFKGRTAIYQFKNPAGKRFTLRIGGLTQRNANSFRVRLDELISAVMANLTPSPEIVGWVQGLPKVVQEKLARVGLITLKESIGLGDYRDRFMHLKRDKKKSTLTAIRVCTDRLVKFFGKDRRLEKIRPGDIDSFMTHLRTTISQATVSQTVKKAKMMFGQAVRDGLISANPMAHVKGGKESNRSKLFFVTPGMTAAVLDACPDAEWRLIFGLARIGGLRVPSEIIPLQWSDIDWGKKRFYVHSPKTEHHEGGEGRWVPLYPELLKLFEEAWEEAEEGEVHVITRYRDAGQNLRTTLNRIAIKAGVRPWPKPWQNARTSRVTELRRVLPAHLVNEWHGHTDAVALEHYAQVTDQDWSVATVTTTLGVCWGGQKSDVKSDVRTAETDVKSDVASCCNTTQGLTQSQSLKGVSSELALYCSDMQSDIVPRVGLEPTTR